MKKYACNFGMFYAYLNSFNRLSFLGIVLTPSYAFEHFAFTFYHVNRSECTATNGTNHSKK